MALKYKIGDRVRIKSIDWYNENKDKNGYIDECANTITNRRFNYLDISLSDALQDV